MRNPGATGPTGADSNVKMGKARNAFAGAGPGTAIVYNGSRQ
jgi:hypothetical protein